MRRKNEFFSSSFQTEDAIPRIRNLQSEILNLADKYSIINGIWKKKGDATRSFTKESLGGFLVKLIENLRKSD